MGEAAQHGEEEENEQEEGSFARETRPPSQSSCGSRRDRPREQKWPGSNVSATTNKSDLDAAAQVTLPSCRCRSPALFMGLRKRCTQARAVVRHAMVAAIADRLVQAARAGRD